MRGVGRERGWTERGGGQREGVERGEREKGSRKRVREKPIELMCKHDGKWHKLWCLISCISIHQSLEK